MPKSKRARVVSLTKTTKKPARENNERLFTAVRECVDTYPTILVFSVDNMRNTHLKDVRSELSDSRLFFGKTKVMAKALGQTAAEEYRDNLSSLSSHLAGNVGLLFTRRPPSEVLEYFATFARTDYARMGGVAPRDFVVPAGVVYSLGGQVAADEDVPLAHSLEPAVRALGMPTRLVKGKVWLDQEFVVCTRGKRLDAKQASLLKTFGCATAEFRVRPVAYWQEESGDVTVVEPEEAAEEEEEAEKMED